jgi:hypothetical protein
MAQASTYHKKPFPPLFLDSYGSLVGEAQLKAWAGFQARLGDYGSRSSKKPSDGKVKLNFIDNDDGSPPTTAQEAAFTYLLKNQNAVRDAFLKSLLPYYAKRRKQYLEEYGVEEIDAVMPDVKKPEDFKKLMGVNIIHFHKVELCGTAYVGFGFGCSWEYEEGLGVVMHKDRVIEIGGATDAFDGYIAEDDARLKKK